MSFPSKFQQIYYYFREMSFILKTCRIVAGASMNSQFHEFLRFYFWWVFAIWTNCATVFGFFKSNEPGNGPCRAMQRSAQHRVNDRRAVPVTPRRSSFSTKGCRIRHSGLSMPCFLALTVVELVVTFKLCFTKFMYV